MSENIIKMFNNDKFGSIRTVVLNDEPYFVGKDIAVALGYAKPENAITNHVDLEDKRRCKKRVKKEKTAVTKKNA